MQSLILFMKFHEMLLFRKMSRNQNGMYKVILRMLKNKSGNTYKLNWKEILFMF